MKYGLINSNPGVSVYQPTVASNDPLLLEEITVDEIISRFNNDSLVVYNKYDDEVVDVEIVKLENWDEWELRFSMDFWSRDKYPFGTINHKLLESIRGIALKVKADHKKEEWARMSGILKRSDIGWVFDVVILQNLNDVVIEEYRLALLDEDIY